MLAAGGTGGHLFPAFALARSSAGAGSLSTSSRTCAAAATTRSFPRARSTGFLRPRLARQVALAAARAGMDAGARRRRGLQADGRGQARRRSRLRRLSGLSAAGRGPDAAHPHRAARAECRARPRQPHAGGRVDRDRHLVRAHQIPGRPRARERPLHRQSGSRNRGRVAEAGLSRARPAADHFRSWCSAAARARVSSPMRVPPALALLPDELRASLFVVQQGREEDLGREWRPPMQAAGMRAASRHLFRQSARRRWQRRIS